MHERCNPFCFGGLHAVLFDVESSELAHLETATKILAANAGLAPAGYTLVTPPREAGAAAPGTPTREGMARGRVIVWGRR